MTITASADIAWPCPLSVWNSEIFPPAGSRERHAEGALLERDLMRRVGAAFRAVPWSRSPCPGCGRGCSSGLVERAGEVGAGIGESEAVAAADVLGLDGVGDDAFVLRLPGVHQQILRVCLGRYLEQDSRRDPLAAGRRVHRPGGVFHRRIELGRVLCFVAEPFGHLHAK